MDFFGKLEALNIPSDQKDAVLSEVKYCYFNYIMPLHKFYFMSDNYKANKDLQEIRQKVNKGKGKGKVKFKSKQIKAFFAENKELYKTLIKSNHSTEEKQRLKREVLNKYHYIEDSAFIISLINRERSEVYFKWFIGIVISIIGLIISFKKL